MDMFITNLLSLNLAGGLLLECSKITVLLAVDGVSCYLLLSLTEPWKNPPIESCQRSKG